MEREKIIERMSTELAGKGFVRDGDTYTREKVYYSTISVNGQMSRKENRDTLKVEFLGIGGTMDGSECEDDMLFFDISHNGEPVGCVGVENCNELFNILSIK